jgi:hypothetical protein
LNLDLDSPHPDRDAEPATPGGVRIRSNVLRDVDRDAAWNLVPGEIVLRHDPRHFSLPNRPPRRQHDERMYYEPCGQCGRTIAVINLDGCNQCSDAPSPEAARRNRERHDQTLARVRDERARLRDET